LQPLSPFFFAISNLPLFFHTRALSFLVLPYYHFPGASYSSRYVSAIGLVDALGLHSFRIVCRVMSGKMVYLLATQHDLMTKKPPAASLPKQPIANTERRGSRRCKITQLMRIRPSDPSKDHFEDMRGSVSVSRSGVFFQSSEPAYEVGMRLFVTMPYSHNPASMAREFLAEVVRRDVLPTGMFGIGFKILMEMGIQHTYNFGPGNTR
jgi:hypothetical protein